MDVGVLSSDLTTFDIDAIGETAATLVRNDSLTRFIFKNEALELVVLEKSEVLPSVIPMGTLLKICDVPGYAHATLDTVITNDVCGKLSVDLDFNDTSNFNTKVVVHDGVTRTAVLVPIIIY